MAAIKVDLIGSLHLMQLQPDLKIQRKSGMWSGLQVQQKTRQVKWLLAEEEGNTLQVVSSAASGWGRSFDGEGGSRGTGCSIRGTPLALCSFEFELPTDDCHKGFYCAFQQTERISILLRKGKGKKSLNSKRSFDSTYIKLRECLGSCCLLTFSLLLKKRVGLKKKGEKRASAYH